MSEYDSLLNVETVSIPEHHVSDSYTCEWEVAIDGSQDSVAQIVEKAKALVVEMCEQGVRESTYIRVKDKNGTLFFFAGVTPDGKHESYVYTHK